MMWLALPASLVAVVLFYLSDRQQRLLDQPLPGMVRALGAVLALLAALFWVLELGVGVGLMVAMWLLVLPALLIVLLVGHYRDTYQKTNGQPGAMS